MEIYYGILISFLLGASVSYYLLNAVFLVSGESYRLQRVLSGMFVYLAVMTLKDVVLVLPGGYTQPRLDYVFMVDGWSAIAYVVFMFELTRSGWATWVRLILLSVPFAVFMGLYAYYQDGWVLTSYSVFLCVFGVLALIEGSRRVYKYMKYVRSEYSNLDNINLSWFWGIMIVFFVIQLMWLLVTKLPSQVGDAIYYVLSIAFWELTLHQCRKLRPVLIPQEVKEEVEEEPNYTFEEKFKRMMAEEQVYRERDLRLEDLARRLGTNRTYLGLYFRNVLHMTFYDYINKMRIEEVAIPMIMDHPEYKLEYVALESGFNSISTFRRAFKKITMVLPREYK